MKTNLRSFDRTHICRSQQGRQGNSVPLAWGLRPCKIAFGYLLVAWVLSAGAAPGLTPLWTGAADGRGIEGSCEAVKFSPNGTTIGSVSRHSTDKGTGFKRVKMWRVSDGKILWTGDHEYQVKYCSFSSDGKLFATTGDDKRANIWDASTGNKLKTFSLGTTSDACSFSRNGELFAVAAREKVTVYRVADWSLVRTLNHGGGEVNAISFSKGDKYVATCAADKTVKLWQVTDGKLLKTMSHSSSVKSCAISPDGLLLASGDSQGITKLWRVPDGSSVKTLNPFGSAKVRSSVGVYDWPNYIETVAFSPGGDFLATGAHDRRIRLYAVESWKLALEYNTQPGKPETGWATTAGRLNVEDIDISRDGNRLAIASEDGTIKMYSLTGVSGGATRAAHEISSAQRLSGNAKHSFIFLSRSPVSELNFRNLHGQTVNCKLTKAGMLVVPAY